MTKLYEMGDIFQKRKRFLSLIIHKILIIRVCLEKLLKSVSFSVVEPSGITQKLLEPGGYLFPVHLFVRGYAVGSVRSSSGLLEWSNIFRPSQLSFWHFKGTQAFRLDV